MRRVTLVAGAILIILTCATSHSAPLLSSRDREVEALLARMTLDERIGQMVQADSMALTAKADVKNYFLGSVLSGGGSDPEHGNTPQDWLGFVKEFQAQALQTRLRIPILYGIDAVHGHNNVDGATLFPHNIGLGATHDAKLIAGAARVTAEECVGTGIRWTFAPCVAVPQNPRWGRTYEGYSDQTALVSSLATAATTGVQGKRFSPDPASVLACAKHFIGDGGTTDGIDQGNTVCDEATLRHTFLPPYEACVKAGIGSIMVSYNSWNGEKMHAQQHLLTDVLKGELGFGGFLVSDWAAIDQINTNDYRDCIQRSINAGLDMIMIPNGPGKPNSYVDFIHHLKALVAEGKVAQSLINDAVRRILRIKFAMGLFESTATDPRLTAAIGSPEHRAVARECVRKSLVLLKNEKLLPLPKNIKRVAVVGPAADDLGMQCGGWTIDWQGGHGQIAQGGTTLLAAIKWAVSPGTEVTFSPDASDLRNPDAVIVVVGEAPYAEMKGDREHLGLPAGDLALIANANASGAAVLTILYSGRPLALGSALADSTAFVAAWLPGSEGSGITDVLFGDYKFTGKLPCLWKQ